MHNGLYWLLVKIFFFSKMKVVSASQYQKDKLMDWQTALHRAMQIQWKSSSKPFTQRPLQLQEGFRTDGFVHKTDKQHSSCRVSISFRMWRFCYTVGIFTAVVCLSGRKVSNWPILQCSFILNRDFGASFVGWFSLHCLSWSPGNTSIIYQMASINKYLKVVPTSCILKSFLLSNLVQTCNICKRHQEHCT